MEGCFMFQWGVCFSDGGASFLSGWGAPHGGINFGGGGGFQKIVRWGGQPPPPPPTIGKPAILDVFNCLAQTSIIRFVINDITIVLGSNIK